MVPRPAIAATLSAEVAGFDSLVANLIILQDAGCEFAEPRTDPRPVIRRGRATRVFGENTSQTIVAKRQQQCFPKHSMVTRLEQQSVFAIDNNISKTSCSGSDNNATRGKRFEASHRRSLGSAPG